MAHYQLPAGGHLINITDGAVPGVVVVYDLGNGANVYYNIPDSAHQDIILNPMKGYPMGTPPESMSLSDFQQKFPHNLTDGGDVSELAGDDIQKAANYQEWFKNLLTTATGGNASWMNDPEITSIWADSITNQISPAETAARVRSSKFAQNQTVAAKQYNDATDAEKASLESDAIGTISDAYFNVTGVRLADTDPTIKWWSHQLASGGATIGSITESVFKPIAMQNSQSPYALQQTNAQTAMRKTGVDQSNKAGALLDLSRRWGVGMDQNTANQWAQKINTNVASDQDFLNTMKNQANVLYPWKDKETETLTAAQPYLSTYSKLMETATPELTNPKIQAAMAAGTSLSDFGQQIRSDPAWMHTDNAKQAITSTAMQVGQRMGFE